MHITASGQPISMKQLSDTRLTGRMKYILKKSKEGVKIKNSPENPENYREEIVYGNDALAVMNYNAYRKELIRRVRA